MRSITQDQTERKKGFVKAHNEQDDIKLMGSLGSSSVACKRTYK